MANPGTVRLTKGSPAVSLAKHGVTSGLVKVNLRWSSPRTVAREEAARATGLFRRLQATRRALLIAESDLDLGCMVKYGDGRKAVVQALGNAFGALDEFPYIALDADDRTGGGADGENLSINLDRQEAFAKILIFVYIYEGGGDFRGLDAVATLSSDRGDRFEVRLDDCPPGANACAIALIERRHGELMVEREVRWFTPKDGPGIHQAISHAYRFDFTWKPGRK